MTSLGRQSTSFRNPSTTRSRPAVGGAVGSDVDSEYVLSQTGLFSSLDRAVSAATLPESHTNGCEAMAKPSVEIIRDMESRKASGNREQPQPSWHIEK